MIKAVPLLAALALLFMQSVSHAQERPALLVLASAHFDNPGRDVVNVEVEDVLTEPRQEEIEDVVERLAAFKPTHIAIEFPSASQERLDERYEAYRRGEYTLSRNESDQLGLRLAAMLDHERIHAADWNGNPPGDEADYNWLAFGQAKIFNRLADIASSPEHRLLVIYGSGHAYLLRQFARESGMFRLIDMDEVL